MYRIIATLGNEPVCLNHSRNVGRLYRNSRIVKIVFFKNRSVIKRAFAKRFGCRRAVFRENMLLDRAAVHAYSDRNISCLTSIYNRPNSFLVSDISGVDAYLINTVLSRFQRSAIVKMNIGNNRCTKTAFLDYSNSFSRIFIGYGYTDYVAPSARESFYLIKSRGGVLCIDISH